MSTVIVSYSSSMDTTEFRARRGTLSGFHLRTFQVVRDDPRLPESALAAHFPLPFHEPLLVGEEEEKASRSVRDEKNPSEQLEEVERGEEIEEVVLVRFQEPAHADEAQQLHEAVKRRGAGGGGAIAGGIGLLRQVSAGSGGRQRLEVASASAGAGSGLQAAPGQADDLEEPERARARRCAVRAPVRREGARKRALR